MYAGGRRAFDAANQVAGRVLDGAHEFGQRPVIALFELGQHDAELAQRLVPAHAGRAADLVQQRGEHVAVGGRIGVGARVGAGVTVQSSSSSHSAALYLAVDSFFPVVIALRPSPRGMNTSARRMTMSKASSTGW